MAEGQSCATEEKAKKEQGEGKRGLTMFLIGVLVRLLIAVLMRKALA